MIGLLAAVALGLTSLRALWQASHLQDALNRGQTLSIAARDLTPPLAAQDAQALTRQVRRLLRHPDLGLTHLTVFDAAGAVLAADGRFERILPWAGALARQQIRGALYRLTGAPGTLVLERDGAQLGRVDYVLAPGFARDVRERALDELRMAGWIGLLLALPSVGALGYVVARRPGRGDPRLLARGRVPARPPSEPEPLIDDPVMASALGERGLHVLDALGRALIVVDRDARIRFMNRTAGELCGWTPDEARGRLVYSVFHPLDEGLAPLVTPAETCLRENRDYPAAELLMRARGGQVHALEVMAARLRDRAGAPLGGALMVFHPIDERRERVERLRRQARLSHGVIDHLVEAVITTDLAGVIRFVNARALRVFAYGRDELEGLPVTRLLPVPFLNAPGVHLTDYVGGRNHSRLPKVLGWRKDGSSFPVELVVQPMSVDYDEGLVVIVRDITERLRSDNLAQRLARLLDATSDEVYVFDAQSLHIVDANARARRNLGYALLELQRFTPLGLSQELEADAFHGHLARLRSGQVEQVRYACRHVRADGSEYPVDVRLHYAREEDPPVFLAIATDTSARQDDAARARQGAQDALTGLPDEAAFRDRVQQARVLAQRSRRAFAVLVIGLDALPALRQRHGAETVDAWLREVAQRLHAALRASDTLARLDDERFAVLAQNLRGQDDAERLAHKLVDLLAAPFDIDAQRLRAVAHAGLALHPPDADDTATLLRHADAALQQARQRSAGAVCCFEVELAPAQRRRLDLEREVLAALTLQQFEVRLAPVLDAARMQVVALRLDYHWMHARHGAVPAAEVRAAAARDGLSAEVELWAVARACALLPAPAQSDQPPLPVIVDVSGVQLADAEFVAQLLQLMERHATPPRRLVLALDREGCEALHDVPAPRLRRLLERGVRLALRGASAPVFAALERGVSAPLDGVVLEAAEIEQVPNDAAVTERVRLVLLAAKGRNLPVLACGVNDAAARDWLQAQGCRWLAGPLLAEMRGEPDLLPWLRSQGLA